MTIVDTAVFFWAQIFYIFAPAISVALCWAWKKLYKDELVMDKKMGCLIAFG